MVMQKDLVCMVEYGDEKFQADVHLQQLENSKVIAKVVPNTLVTTLSTECFLESASGEDRLKLKKSHGSLASMTHPAGEGGLHTEIKVSLEQAEFEYSPLPADEDIVTAKMYVTNLPYFQRDKDYTVTVSGQEIIFSPFKEGAISNIVRVCDVPYASIVNIKQLVESICWLTSFACGRLSGIARIEVLRGNDLINLNLRSIMTEFKPSIQVIYSDFDSAQIIQFIGHSYDQYKRLCNKYLTNNLINMGVLAKNTSYRENKILLMSNFLEALRYNYALNIGVPNGLFVHKGTDFIWKKGRTAKKKAYFKSILKQFCKDNNITHWKDDFKILRDEIVHTGTVRDPNAWERYFDLHHFCDCVILALLEWDRVGGRYIPANCPSYNGPAKWGMNIIPFAR